MLTRGSMSAPVGVDISYCSLERLPCLVLLTAFLIWGRVRLDETYCLSGFERLYDLVITYCWSGSERPHGPDDTYVYGGSWSGRAYDLTDSTLYCGSIWIWAHFRRNDTNLESGFKLSVLWHDDSYCLSGTDIFASQGSSVHFYLSGSEGTYGLMIFTATLDLSGLSACWYLIWVLLWARLQIEQWSLYLPRVCFWAPSRPDDKRSFPAASETGTLVSIASALDAFPYFLEISPTDCRCNLTLAWSYYCIRFPPLQFWESYINISMHFIYKYLLFIVCNCSFTV